MLQNGVDVSAGSVVGHVGTLERYVKSRKQIEESTSCERYSR